MTKKLDKAMIGAAGEHLVLSRLLSRGMLAAPAPRGVGKVDILVNFLDRGEPCLVQVKTALRGSRGWAMQAKHQEIVDDDLYYCFVDFEPEHPTVHVVPAVVVAETLAAGHKLWLETPGKHGQQHNDNNMRRFNAKLPGPTPDWLNDYLECWEQLEPQA